MVDTARVLTVQNVTRRFGGLVAVNNLSFDVKRNEVMGIIGPNGSGKTTMINLISGALGINEGSISLNGRYISTIPSFRINQRGVARTFQLVRILPSLSLIENCMAGMVFGHQRLWGDRARHEAVKLLERVGLDANANAPVGSLTYIDQKRLELARALASKPEVLLLDEWLAGLNPTELQDGIDLIHSLRDDGLTIILVEHVMDAIRSLCDRCIVMASGTKIAEGVPEDVLAEPEVIKVYLGEDI
ncbi:ABC transporter ATP-binding protein [Alphaproteobacteria bacterium]|nr:ABC transporter ATP-binding protein [Alphaproteobacteria bacterium]